MRRHWETIAALLVGLLGGACAGRTAPGATLPNREPLPPPTPHQGPLVLRVVYPPSADDATVGAAETRVVAADSGYVIQAHDSTFLLGGTGRGDARLWINGEPVPVYPTGGWLAWLPLPADSVATFQVLAVAGPDTARITLRAPIASRFRAPETGLWIDTTSLAPLGAGWLRPGEGVTLRVRATRGAAVRGILPDGRALGFVPEELHGEVPWGAVAFDRAVEGRTGPVDSWYAAWATGPLGPDPGCVMLPSAAPDPADSSWMWLEAARNGDTVRVRWPLRLGVIDPARPTSVRVDDDTAGTGATDSVLAGRPLPEGTYHWFFPTGTRARVSGRWNEQVRLQLSRASVAWVDATDVQALPEGTPPPRAVVRSLRVFPGATSVTVRLPANAQVPFRVDEAGDELALTLYGAVVDADWVHYGGTDPLVRAIRFDQPAEDVVTVTVELREPVWGYRTRWGAGALELEIRRPPAIDPRRPLRGRTIALDPGHPPGGARGPTGTREAGVVLAVARDAQRLLEAAGASVVLLRADDRPVGLAERVRMIEQGEAEVLVSIHANALPDGVNPFVNHGTSVYYFHPRSAPLARALDRALVRQLGVPDLGYGRGDLALVRPTWVPAALTEGLFMMLPDHEAMLLSEEGRRRYAQGIVDGLEAFLAGRARAR